MHGRRLVAVTRQGGRGRGSAAVHAVVRGHGLAVVRGRGAVVVVAANVGPGPPGGHPGGGRLVAAGAGVVAGVAVGAAGVSWDITYL